jgi:antitoxin (DNA-binding transcriptional repressor) of toxin-antitoxin stability system
MRDHVTRQAQRKGTRKSVGVRELKTHAARILRQVREARASYLLMHRGRAIGVMLPAPDSCFADCGSCSTGGYLAASLARRRRSLRGRRSSLRHHDCVARRLAENARRGGGDVSDARRGAQGVATSGSTRSRTASAAKGSASRTSSTPDKEPESRLSSGLQQREQRSSRPRFEGHARTARPCGVSTRARGRAVHSTEDSRLFRSSRSSRYGGS